MPRPGRRSASTREQREQVLRLVAEGVSRRAVAQEVFGDECLHGRVDRIIREAKLDSGRSEITEVLEGLGEQPLDAAGAGEATPSLEDLFTRYARELRQCLDGPDEQVSANELVAFARLELWLENKRRVEEANRLTRELDA